MKTRAAHWLLAAIFIAVSILPTASAVAPVRDQPIGMDISGFSTTDIFDQPVDGSVLQEYQLTVINLWATWCGPCLSELADFQRFYRDYESKGVNVMGLLLEDTESNAAGAVLICEQKGITYTNLRYIRDRVLAKLAESVANEGLPTTFLVNRDGVVLEILSVTNYSGLIMFVSPHLNKEPTGIVITPNDMSIEAGEEISLNASLVPEGCSVLKTRWSSSDTRIATVDEAGTVTGVAGGEVTITCRLSNGVSQDITVTVEGEPPAPEFLNTPHFARVEDGSLSNNTPYLMVAEYNGELYLLTSEQTQIGGISYLKAIKVDSEDITRDSQNRLCIINPKTDTAAQWNFEACLLPETPATRELIPYNIKNAETGFYLAMGSQEDESSTLDLLMTDEATTVWTYNCNEFFILDSSLGYIISLIEQSGLPKFGALPADDENAITVTLYSWVEHERLSLIPGDANYDGKVNTGDAAAILQSLIGSYTFTEQGKINADFNLDLVINSGDAAAILKSIVA